MNTAIHPRCPIRTSLDLIGGKWSLLVIQHIEMGATRFSELSKALPEISEKVLTQELRNLQDHDLINKHDHDSKMSYTLTHRGKLALPVIKALAEFGLAYCKPVGKEELKAF